MYDEQEAYDEGFEDGEHDGYEEGWSEGHEQGYAEGHADGQDAGEAEGFERGVNDETQRIIDMIEALQWNYTWDTPEYTILETLRREI